MKVFYLCRTGHHTSIIAAALHLGMISLESGDNKLYDLKGFDDIEFKDIGKPFFVGTDSFNTEIYTVGVWNDSQIMSRAINDLVSLIGLRRGEWQVIDVSPAVSRLTVAGLNLKKFRLKPLAKALVSLGARREIKRLTAYLVDYQETILYH